MRRLQIRRKKTGLTVTLSRCSVLQIVFPLKKEKTLCIISSVQRQGVYRVCSQKGFKKKNKNKCQKTDSPEMERKKEI